MYNRTDDDILPARRRGRRRSGAKVVRAETGHVRPGPPPGASPLGIVGARPAPPAEPSWADDGAGEPEPAPGRGRAQRRHRQVRQVHHVRPPAPPPARRRGAERRAAKPRGDEPRAAEPGAERAGRRLLVEVLLTVGALLGVAVAGVTVLAVQSGLRPLVVRSGSMEPTIPVGSMVLVRRIPASKIEVGQVVAVERPDHTRVTHRVIAVEHHGETAELTMKGDANEDPDAEPVTVRHGWLLVHHVPELGKVGGWVATAQGGFVIGSIVTAVVLTVLRRRPRSGPAPAGG